MVLAHGIEFDILYDYHFVSVRWKHGVVDDFVDIHRVALREELHSLCCPLWGVYEPCSLRVFANLRKNIQKSLFHSHSPFLEIFG